MRAFTGVHGAYYWSSTSRAAHPNYAWCVALSFGLVGYCGHKTYAEYYVWPVRAGQ
jgi:hypothetical protein